MQARFKKEFKNGNKMQGVGHQSNSRRVTTAKESVSCYPKRMLKEQNGRSHNVNKTYYKTEYQQNNACEGIFDFLTIDLLLDLINCLQLEQ